MTYAKALQKTIAAEPAVTGRSLAELQRGIAAITAELKGPMRDADRIMLAAYRSAMRTALANATPTPAAADAGEGA